MRSANPAAAAAALDDFTPVVGRHNRHSAQHTKRSRLPPQDEHKQHRLSFDDKQPPPPSTAAFSPHSHSPASSRRSSRASNPRKSSYDEMDDDGDWDSRLTYEEKHNEASNSGSSSRRQRVQSNADSYDGANEYDDYDEAIASEDSDAAECPLCMERLDPTDLAFHPCICGYKVCLYCYNNILDNLNGQCPACRREYDRSLASTASLAQLGQPTVAQQSASERKDKKRIKERERRKATQHDRNSVSQQQQAQLASVRVIQRNLVYICGLPPGAAYEDWLKKRENFGRFGKIIKASVTKRSGGSHEAVNAAPSASSSSQRTTNNNNVYSAYVTYKSPSSAAACIAAMHLSAVMGASIRCTYGTTKYCAFFVRGQPCTNTACLYLHELARSEDCVGKDELTEERLGHPGQQVEKLERQSSASSQQSGGGQLLATAAVNGSTSTLASPLVSVQPTAATPAATASNTLSPRVSTAGSLGLSSPSSNSSASLAPASAQAVLSALNRAPSSSANQPHTPFAFPAPAPTRSVSEGWAAVAAAGAAASQSHCAEAEDMSPVVPSSVSSVPASLLASAPLPPPIWAAVPSSTSAAALLSQAIQAEKERESAETRESRELRQPSATQPLPPTATGAEPIFQPSHTAGSVIRRPPPGFERMAGWSAAAQTHALSASTSSSAHEDDSSFFSMFAFPPPVASAGRSSPHSLSTALPTPSHDHSLQQPSMSQPTFRSITSTTSPLPAGESTGAKWDFNAFVEQLRATTTNLQSMPFVGAEDGASFTAASQHRDALQKVLFSPAEPAIGHAVVGANSAIRQLRPSGGAGLAGSVLDPPLFPAPLSSVTQQLSAFSSLLSAASPSLHLLSSDVSGGGLSATDTDDDWSARADRVDGFDVSFAINSPRAPYKPSGFDDSPPLTALASLRHSLPPPPLALETPHAVSNSAAAATSGSPHHSAQPTIRILSTPTEVVDVPRVKQQGGGGDDAAAGLLHINPRNGRHSKVGERGGRRISNRDNGRRNHGSPNSDGTSATGKKAPVLSLSSPQHKLPSSTISGEEQVSSAALSSRTPAAQPAVSTSSPILQLKRTPSSADKQTSPSSPNTPSVSTSAVSERPVDAGGSGGNTPPPEATAQPTVAAALASPKPILSLAPRRNGQLVRNISEPDPQSNSQPQQPQPVRGLSQTQPASSHAESRSIAAGADSDRTIPLVGPRPHGRTAGRAHHGRQQRAHGSDSSGGSGLASPVQRYSAAPVSTSSFNSPPLVRLSLSKGLSSLSIPAADSHAAPSVEPPPLIAPSHSPHIVDRPAAVFDAITPPSGSGMQLSNGNGRHTSASGNRDRERQPRVRDRYRVRDEPGETDGQRDRRGGEASLAKR